MGVRPWRGNWTQPSKVSLVREPYSQTYDLDFGSGLESPARAKTALRISPLLAGASVLTLFFVSQILQPFPQLSGLQLAKLTAAATTVIFLVSRRGLIDRVKLSDAIQLKYLVLILLLAIVTIPWSVWPAASWGYIVDVYSKNVLYAYLLVQAVKTDADSRVIAGVMVIGSTALALAILTHFGPVVSYQSEPGRLGLGTYDPNDLALLFVVTVPFAFFLMKSARTRVRLLLVASILIMLAAMFKGESRGGFLGLLAIGTLMFLRAPRQARKYTLITLALGVALFVFAAPRTYWDRISTISNLEADYNLHVEGGRIPVWKEGLRMIAESPLTGVGIACFPFEQSRLSESRLDKAPHNSFLQAAAELGVIGLGLFLVIVISAIVISRRIRRAVGSGTTDPSLLWLASAVEISLIGYAVSGFFLSHAYSGIICFLTAMAAAMTARYKVCQRNALPVIEEVEYA
ncbi:MAG: O-antigen ligase family protein [Blastocatellia bacterium]